MSQEQTCPITVDKTEAREAMEKLDAYLNIPSGGSEITSSLLQGGTGKEKGGRPDNLTPFKN
jgi:hypothetical protein